MKKVTLATFIFILVNSFCFADTSDDTLKYFLSKSDMVVLGTIVSEPMGVMYEFGVVNYYCDFKITDVCKGDNSLKDKTIKVNIIRFEMDKKDHNPLIKKDSECFLFLKNKSNNSSPAWETSDFWFGVQYPSSWMIKSMKRLVKEIDNSNDSKDTLKFFLSKSDLVVLGTITSEPTGYMTEAGVINYICDFKIAEVCKGDNSLKDKTTKINIIRFGMDKEGHFPLIKKDSECILFLNKTTNSSPAWETSDIWFGIQYPSPLLVESLKRMVEQEK